MSLLVQRLTSNSRDSNVSELTNASLCLLPVSDLSRLNDDEFDSGVVGGTVVYAIT